MAHRARWGLRPGVHALAAHDPRAVGRLGRTTPEMEVFARVISQEKTQRERPHPALRMQSRVRFDGRPRPEAVQEKLGRWSPTML
jgi:hypothetical protein